MNDIPSDTSGQPPNVARHQVGAGQQNGGVSVQRAAVEGLPEAIEQRVTEARATADIAAKRLVQEARQTSEPRQPETPRETRVRIEGRVVERDPESRRYTVRTAEGDIALRAERAQAETPPVDTRVRVHIPPNPQNAEDQQAATVRVEILPASLAAPDDTAVPVRSSQTPIQVAIQDAPPVENTTTPLDLKSAIRVEAITAEAAANLITASQAVVTGQTSLPPAAIADVISSLNTPAGHFTQPALTLPPPLATLAVVARGDTALPTLPKSIAAFAPQPTLITRNAEALLTAPVQRAAVQTNLNALSDLTVPIASPSKSAITTADLVPVQNTAPTVIAVTQYPAGTPPVFDTARSSLLSATQAGEQQAIFAGKTVQNVPVLRLQAVADTALSSVQASSLQGFTSVYSQPPIEGSQFLLVYGSLGETPVGAALQITPQSVTPHAAATGLVPLPDIPAHIPATPILAPLILNTGTWPALDDIHQTLVQAAPQAAQAFASLTPSPANAPQMMPAALFFIAAIKGGDLQSWLGDKAVEILQKAGKGQGLSRLMQEGRAMTRLASEGGSEWRSIPLPFYFDGAFQKMLLHTRQEHHSDVDPQTGGKAVRFIFDLAYDRIGDVQLDGLFRSHVEGGRLDVILRTEQHFSQAMQAEMRRLYAGAVEQAGVGGELSFQTALQQWVTIDYQESAFGSSA